MSVPLLRQGQLLIASLPGAATDHDLRALLDDVADEVGRNCRGVVLDVSALDVLDSFATRVLETVGQVARLRGADTVVVGVQPDVALSMVQLGVTLEGVRTALDLEDALELLGDGVTGGQHGA